ncbi:uncharacterized protein FTOL_13461 [Fusarium torulosum]|uniref:Uncharacterized protein n=1 Tax=Fusarium torulosum TaxID=33205 RepID=A0AAE8MNN0_9HYPO|nr:uncharacterized protein FTOL_13461 [Fusarium torulosum]
MPLLGLGPATPLEISTSAPGAGMGLTASRSAPYFVRNPFRGAP